MFEVGGGGGWGGVDVGLVIYGFTYNRRVKDAQSYHRPKTCMMHGAE